MISGINKSNKVFIAGHNGMVGSAIIRKLKSIGIDEDNIITRKRNELDLTNQNSVNSFFNSESISFIFLAAAKSVELWLTIVCRQILFYENILIQSNIINAAYKKKCKKINISWIKLYLSKNADQPIKRRRIFKWLSREPTNRPYAVAKFQELK